MLERTKNKPNRGYCLNAGFTLLELLIVITIIGVLAAIAIPNYFNYKEKVRYSITLREMRMIEQGITIFNLEQNRFPNDLNEIGLGSMNDPWGNPYRYLNIATTKGKGKMRKDHSMVPVNSDFDLYSMGPDGDSKSPFTAKASRDDIVRANDGAFFGRVSDY